MTEQNFCVHQVQYYETDAMGIVHHSNYIRWFEEARMFFLQKAGLDYDKMEDRGIIIPVLSASCEYKQAVRFGEEVKIFLQVESFNGLRFQLSYRVYDMEEKILHAAGTTRHCFLDKQMRPVNVKKCAADIYEYFSAYLKK